MGRNELPLSVVLLGATVVALGAGVGVGLSLVFALESRRAKRSEEERAALAMHLAQLTHRDSSNHASYTTSEQPSSPSPSSNSSSAPQEVKEKSAERANHVRTAEQVLERTSRVQPYRLNDMVDDLADVLSVYRKQYQNWRKGHHVGAKTQHERMLMSRNFRSLTQGEASEIFIGSDDSERLTTHLWHHLNLGPSNAHQKPVKVAVIGGGAFGTAMAAAAGRNGHNVIIYMRRREAARDIKLTRRNDRYLPGLELPPTVSATCDLKEALAGVELIIHALPAQKSPEWIAENRDLIPPGVIYCSTAKGLHLESNSLLSVAMLKAFGRDQPFAVLSGPSFAKEIVTEQPTSVVVASKKLSHAVKIQRLMSSTSFRVYASQDTIGVELGGALKNPLALGAGMIEGLGFGINTMSAYVTRSCAELTSLCVAMGGRPETIAGLSGIGDLMLTAFGSLSRNRSCGIRLVKGEKLEDILATTTVEGVPTAKVAVLFAAECNLHLPIFQTVCSILSGRLKPEDFVVTAMMTRPLTMEHHTTPLSEVEAVTQVSAANTSASTAKN